MNPESLHIGTCSWRYASWQGLVYSERKPANYLQEYSHHYSTVEVDQWFWSLFAGDKVVLPKPEVVRDYADSVPENFIFCVKVPNSITLTHHYKKNRSDPLRANPHFLSSELMHLASTRLSERAREILLSYSDIPTGIAWNGWPESFRIDSPLRM